MPPYFPSEEEKIISAERFFFQEGMPTIIEDVVKNIIVNLESHSIAMMGVNKSWYQLITEDTVLYRDIFILNYINRAKTSAEKIKNITLSSAYCQITKIEAQNYDLMQAFQTLKKIPDFLQCKALKLISIVNARQKKPKEAIEFARIIKDDSYIDYSSKESTFLEIAKIIAIYDLNQAKEIVQYIKGNELK